MRGRPNPQRSMLAIVDLEERIPRDHPLRRIKEVADAALARLSPVFDGMYAQVGRASVPPERLLKASLLIALYSVRSERAFCEELEYNLLYRWFLDMDLMERSFDATVFTKNRQRLLAHDAGRALFDEVVWAADEEGLLSDEHFSVDGTLIEAAAKPQELPVQGGTAPADGRRSGQPLGGFPGGAPPQRDPRQHHGSRGAPATQGAGQGGPAGVYGPRPDGEPPRSVDGLHHQPGNRHGRAGCGAGASGRGPGTGLPPAHAGSRPRLRHQGLCPGHAGVPGDPACRTKEETLGP